MQAQVLLYPVECWMLIIVKSHIEKHMRAPNKGGKEMRRLLVHLWNLNHCRGDDDEVRQRMEEKRRGCLFRTGSRSWFLSLRKFHVIINVNKPFGLCLPQASRQIPFMKKKASELRLER
jgi:hypothetical protein